MHGKFYINPDKGKTMFNLKNNIIAASILGLSMIPSKIEIPPQTRAFAQEKLEDKVIGVKIKNKMYKVDKDYTVTLNEKSVGDEEELLKVVELAKLVEEARKIQDYRIDFFGLWDLEALKYSSLIRKGQAITMKYDDHIKWALSFPIKFLEHALSGTLDIPKESRGYVLMGMKRFLENPQENLKNYSFMLYNNSNQRLEENASFIRKMSKSGFIDEETAIKIKDNSDYAEIFGNAALEYYKELQKYDTLEKRWFIELIPGIKDMLEKEYEILPKEAIVYLERAFLSKLKNYPPNKKFEELIETNRNNLIRKKSNYLVNLKNYISNRIFWNSPEIAVKKFIDYACTGNMDKAFKMLSEETKKALREGAKENEKAIEGRIKEYEQLIKSTKDKKIKHRSYSSPLRPIPDQKDLEESEKEAEREIRSYERSIEEFKKKLEEVRERKEDLDHSLGGRSLKGLSEEEKRMCSGEYIVLHKERYKNLALILGKKGGENFSYILKKEDLEWKILVSSISEQYLEEHRKGDKNILKEIEENLTTLSIK